ncbi:MAG: PEFG-CTERM sorting domain-containing protein, partial [Nitrosopumilaceae archaeon]
VISIDAASDGTITANIPRDLMDAKTTAGADDVFIVRIDGAEVPYNEEKTTNSRTLTIQFLEEDSEIKITGTKIAS